MDHYFTSNENLKSEIKEIKYNIFDDSFSFFTDLGVFSKKSIDYGTHLLIKTYLENKKEPKKILDVGCGYGAIGIILSKITNSEVDMIDINNRAIHLTKMNIKSNKVKCNAFYSDVYSNIKNKYDVIITNPPIRAGKSKVLEILSNAKNYLNKKGILWFVIRKNQGALSIKKLLEKDYLIKILLKNKGYFVFTAEIR